VRHNCCSALERTPNPQSEPAVIVRHRIVKPRLDDELAALDDLRVVDERHDAHFVLSLRAQQRIDLPDILDQLTPRSRWNAPRLRREMLDDFHRISHSAFTRSYNFNNA